MIQAARKAHDSTSSLRRHNQTQPHLAIGAVDRRRRHRDITRRGCGEVESWVPWLAAPVAEARRTRASGTTRAARAATVGRSMSGTQRSSGHNRSMRIGFFAFLRAFFGQNPTNRFEHPGPIDATSRRTASTSHRVRREGRSLSGAVSVAPAQGAIPGPSVEPGSRDRGIGIVRGRR